MTLPATYYEATSSCAIPVVVHLDEGAELRIESALVNRIEQLKDCPLSEPLGRMARFFSLPDGAKIEITEIGPLAEWEKQRGRGSAMHLVHYIESHWRWVAAAVVFMLVFTAALYLWGLPFAAKRIALRLPPRIGEIATEQAMEIIPRLLSFEPSKLSEKRQGELTAGFQKMVAAMDSGSRYKYRLTFYKAPMANAFALPDGLVCITDKLVKKAKNDNEIYGVLSHEIVHVREQHGMRGLLQNSTVFLIWTLMTGDVSTIAGMGSALPAMLAEKGYSRGFEQEADLGGADYMIQAGWGIQPLCDMLLRIDPERPSLGDAEEALASHPLTRKRVQTLQDYEKAKKAGK